MRGMMRRWNPVLQDGSLNEKEIESPIGFRKRMVRIEPDIFSNRVKEETIRAVFVIMGQSGKCTFILNTSHPWRTKAILDRWNEDRLTLREGHGAVLPNVWIGTVVTNQYEADSLLPILVRTRAAKKWVSIPHLFDPLYLTSFKDLSGERKPKNQALVMTLKDLQIALELFEAEKNIPGFEQ